MVLPPFFRFLAQLFTLPHRRFYTPATDYTSVPPEKGLHPIPSVIDLPSHLAVDATGMSTATIMDMDSRFHPYRALRNLEGTGLKARNASGNSLSGAAVAEKPRGKGYVELEKNSANGNLAEEVSNDEDDVVKRYDVDGKFF